MVGIEIRWIVFMVPFTRSGIWWLIRAPITLILDKNVPGWWFPKW